MKPAKVPGISDLVSDISDNHRADGILVDEYRQRLYRHMTETAASLLK